MTTLDAIQSPVSQELSAVNALILKELSSNVAVISEIGHYLVNSGGKRLRPLILLLTAKALGFTEENHITLAAVVEFIHTATLLHDDVVDASFLRRGLKTANAKWGNEASVLVGDFLYSRAFQMMVRTQNEAVMAIMADTTNIIAEGEVLQLLNAHDLTLSENAYFEVIQRKTAQLFSAATEIGAVLANTDRDTQSDMAEFGMELGMAFQLIDDVLDYTGDVSVIGKNLGDDLKTGKMTLPLIYILRQGNEPDKTQVLKAIQSQNPASFEKIVPLLQQSGALEFTRETAKLHAQKAVKHINTMPPSVYKNPLLALTEFAINRAY